MLRAHSHPEGKLAEPQRHRRNLDQIKQSDEMGRFYAECRAAAAEEGPALPLATEGERGAFRSPEPVVRFGVDGLDPSAAPRARKTSALIVELWRARTMGDIAPSVRT